MDEDYFDIPSVYHDVEESCNVQSELSTKEAEQSQTYIFEEEFVDEFDAFRKYFKNIQSNGYISKLLEEIDDLEVVIPCYLFNEVPMKYRRRSMNLEYYGRYDYTNQNKKVMYANKCIQFRDTSEKGRHFEAAEDISTNVELINECPTIFQVTPMCKCVGSSYCSVHRCHHCGSACAGFYTCYSCNVCIFCSEECLFTAEIEYHRYECYGVQRHFWNIEQGNDYSYLSLRMFLYGASHNFETTGTSFYGSYLNNYPYIYKLQSHFKKMSLEQINKALYNSARNLVYLLNKSKFFSDLQATDSVKSYLLHVGGLLVKHYCQAQVNNVLVEFQNIDLAPGLYRMSGSGKAICPTIALINHSCCPNAIILVYDHLIVVKTIKPIKKGEEITLCYSEVDSFWPACDRRLVTEYFLGFTCNCSLCESELQRSEMKFMCTACKSANVIEIITPCGRYIARCPKCKKYVSREQRNRVVKQIVDYAYKWSSSKSIDYLIKILDIFKEIFMNDSLYILNMYSLIHQKYIETEGDTLNVLKYSLLIFEILEKKFSSLYFPLLAAKHQILMKMMCLVELRELKTASPEILMIVNHYTKDIHKVRMDLLFYLTPNIVQKVTDNFTEILNTLSKLQTPKKTSRRFRR